MVIGNLFKDKNGKVVIFQAPNIAIILWFAFLVLSKFSNGVLSNVFSCLSFVALMVWASLEIFKGESLFRKILGLIVLTFYLYYRLFA